MSEMTLWGRHPFAKVPVPDHDGMRILDTAAGGLSLADLYLAPIAFYVSLPPDRDAPFDVPGSADWWTRMQSLQSCPLTQPKLG